MRLFESIGPNPGVVKMYLHEKGLDVPRVQIDVIGGENRRAPFLAKNPAATVPALELDDGTMLTESVAICEYLEESGSPSALIGKDPQSCALTRMWVRLVTFRVCEPLTLGFRFGEGLGLFENRIRCVPEASAGFKAVARDGLHWVNAQMSGRPYVAGPTLTLADIVLYCFVEFGSLVGQPLDPAHRTLAAWFGNMKARPSAVATAYKLS